jgi:hypothetical protein
MGRQTSMHIYMLKRKVKQTRMEGGGRTTQEKYAFNIELCILRIFLFVWFVDKHLKKSLESSIE